MDQNIRLVFSYRVLEIQFLFCSRFRCLGEHTYKDVCFTVHGMNFFAHRLVLSVRSPYFADMFATKWLGRKSIKINNHKVDFSLDIFTSQAQK